MAVEIHISKIILNVNGLNAPTKRHRLAEWIQNRLKVGKAYFMQMEIERKLEQQQSYQKVDFK